METMELDLRRKEAKRIREEQFEMESKNAEKRIKETLERTKSGSMNAREMEDSLGTCFSKLPVEVILEIFGYLTAEELIVSSRVCVSWKLLSTDVILWRNLYHNVHFALRFWSDEQARILKSIRYGVRHHDPNVRAVAFETLANIAAVNYEAYQERKKKANRDRQFKQIFSPADVPKLTKDWLQTFVEVSLNTVQSDQDVVVLQCIEFWCSLCEGEKSSYLGPEMATYFDPLGNDEVQAKTGNFGTASVILDYVEPITKALLQCLLKQEDQQQDSWTVHIAAASCLSVLANIAYHVHYKVALYVVEFVKAHLDSDEWKRVDAALLAIGSVVCSVGTIPSLKMMGYIHPIIEILASHPVETVKETAAWCLGRVARFDKRTVISVLLTQDQHIDTMEKVVFQEGERVTSKLCWAIASCIQSTTEYESNISVTRMRNRLANDLLQVTLRFGDAYCSIGYDAISVAMNGSVSENIVTLMNPLITDHWKKILDNSKTKDMNKHLQYLSEITKQLVNQVGAQILQHSPDLLLELLLETLKTGNISCKQETAAAITAFMRQHEVDSPQTPEVLDSLLEFTLPLVKDYRNKEYVTAALNILTDITQSVKEVTHLVPSLNDIVTVLVAGIQNPATKEYKQEFIACLGDVALAAGSHFAKFLPIVVDPVLSEAQKPLKGPQRNSIRKDLLETVAIILQSVEDKPDAFVPYINTTLQLLRSVQADVNRDGQVSAAAVGLFGDLVRVYKAQVVNLIDKPLKQLIYEASVDLFEYKAREMSDWILHTIREVDETFTLK